MRPDLTRALMWGRNAARTKASATAAAGGGMRGLRARAALVAALALLGALALATPASAFVKATSFDGSRTPAGSFVPERMAVDQTTGNVYVIDSASSVVDIFNRYGKYLSQLTSAVTANCTLGGFGFDGAEDDIAVDNSSAGTQGNVYIVGQDFGLGLSVITAFDRNGTCLWQENSPISPPTRLAGVAVDPTNGDVYIGDRRNGIFTVSAANGSLVLAPTFGLNGQPAGSGTSESVVHMAFDSSGNLYAQGVLGGTVQYMRGVGSPPFSDPPTNATFDTGGGRDVEVDTTTNDVFVDDGNTINVYNSTDTPNARSPFDSAVSVLHGLAIDGPAGHIYVANNDTNTVEIWGYDPGLTVDPLTVTIAGTGRGNVDADHGAIQACGSGGGPCTDNYLDTDTVDLTATAGAGATFAGWSGPDASACADPSANVCDVSMNAAKNITATFNPVVVPHNLRVTCAGNGGGSVAPVACGATQAETTQVTLTTTADGNSTFSGWTGCDSVSGNRCTVNMTTDTNVTATFARLLPTPTHTLTVSKNGTGTGTVTSSPGGIACGAGCSALFNEGTSVTLTAVADSGSTFAGWSGGGCSGTGTCTVGLNTDTTVTATFNQIPGCPQDLTKCPPPVIRFVSFNSKTLQVRLSCTGFAGQPACTGKLTFKAVIKVKVKKGKKTKLVKKTITVATASYSVAAGGSGSVKLKLTSAAKTALKSGSLTAKSTNPSATIHLPKTKKPKPKKKRH